MTTGQCAKALNEALGEPLFTCKYIRGRIEDGELRAAVYVKGSRKRAFIEIAQSDFRLYVLEHHTYLAPKIGQVLRACTERIVEWRDDGSPQINGSTRNKSG